MAVPALTTLGPCPCQSLMPWLPAHLQGSLAPTRQPVPPGSRQQLDLRCPPCSPGWSTCCLLQLHQDSAVRSDVARLGHGDVCPFRSSVDSYFGLMTGSTTLRAPGLQISGLCQESGSWVLSSAVTSSSCPGSRVSLHGHLLLSALPSSLGRVSLPLGALSVGTGAGGVRSSFLFMTGGGLEHMETEFGVISGLHPQRSWSQEMNRNNHGLSVLT